MTRDEIIKYVIESPYNTNPAVLEGMLDQYKGEGVTNIENGKGFESIQMKGSFANGDHAFATGSGSSAGCRVAKITEASQESGILTVSVESADFSKIEEYLSCFYCLHVIVDDKCITFGGPCTILSFDEAQGLLTLELESEDYPIPGEGEIDISQDLNSWLVGLEFNEAIQQLVTVNIGQMPIGHNTSSQGNDTFALNSNSHAEGDNTVAIGYNSHVEGYQTTAIGFQSHAEGDTTFANGHSSHTEGENSIAVGEAAHAEGIGAKANGSASHAENLNTVASGGQSHAEGNKTVASGKDSHAEGYQTTSSAQQTHAEGNNTTASQNQAHAEGYNTTASGYHSHAEGEETVASGTNTHAAGKGTIAKGQAQTVIGKYNRENTTDVFVVGGGSSEHRENLLTVGKALDGGSQVTIIELGDINGTGNDCPYASLTFKFVGGDFEIKSHSFAGHQLTINQNGIGYTNTQGNLYYKAWENLLDPILE